MSELQDIKQIIDLYTYYYKNVNKLEYFIFKMTPSKKKTVIGFIQEMKRITNSELQEDYLKLYFDYQFNRWYKKDNPYGKGISIQIEWIIGKKAMGLWLGSDKKYRSFIVRKNLKTDVSFVHKFKKENYKNILVSGNAVEENNKKRFFNSNQGFSYCLIATTLYNHNSKFCSDCKSAVKCKGELLSEYPKIFKMRGYENVR